jgi:hypothetical protein
MLRTQLVMLKLKNLQNMEHEKAFPIEIGVESRNAKSS